MDPDFKPQASTDPSVGTPITVNTGASSAPQPTVVSGSVDGVSNATPSLVSNPPISPVKAEPDPVIAAAAAELKDTETKPSLSVDEPKKVETKTTETAKKPKKRTGLFLLSLLLVSALSAAGGWFAHSFLHKSSAPQPAVTPVTKKQEIASALTATTLIAELSKSSTPGVYVEGLAPINKPATSKFYAQPISTPSASVNFPVTATSKEAVYQKTKTWFESKSFTATPIGTADPTNKVPAITFTSKDGAVLCSMNIAPASASPTTPDDRLFIYCANEADYTSYVTKVTPLYDQYLLKNPDANKTGNLVLSKYTDMPSKTTGYTLAEVGIGDVSGGGSRALFYQSADKAWHYVVSHQSTTASVPCTTYNTPELKKAYLDQACMNGTTASTVKL